MHLQVVLAMITTTVTVTFGSACFPGGWLPVWRGQPQPMTIQGIITSDIISVTPHFSSDSGVQAMGVEPAPTWMVVRQLLCASGWQFISWHLTRLSGAVN